MPKLPPSNTPPVPRAPPSVDMRDDGEMAVTPLNITKKPQSSTAVAIAAGDTKSDAPRIIAAGRGKIAEQILQLAFDNGVKVREDSALATMLATIELDSPIPSEAFLAVAEILSYVYKANGQANPFDTLLALESEERAKESESL